MLRVNESWICDVATDWAASTRHASIQMYFGLEHPDRADRAVQWGRGDEDAARRAGRAGSAARRSCSFAAGAVFAAGLGPTPAVSIVVLADGATDALLRVPVAPGAEADRGSDRSFFDVAEHLRLVLCGTADP